MIAKKPRTYQRRTTRGRLSNRAYVARIARTVVAKRTETKCFSAQIVSATNGTSSWQYASALAGLVQGTAANNRLGASIQLVAVEFFISVTPIVAATGTNGSTCRLAVYHDKAANGTGPVTAELWDVNSLITGRNVNFAKKYSILEDITHNMVITSSNAGTAVSVGPPMFRALHIPIRTVIPYGANGGTISDLTVHDVGIGFVTDDTNCCLVNIYSKAWFKDL